MKFVDPVSSVTVPFRHDFESAPRQPAGAARRRAKSAKTRRGAMHDSVLRESRFGNIVLKNGREISSLFYFLLLGLVTCVVVASKKQKTIPYFVVNQQLTTDGFLFCLFFHITKELNLKVEIDVLF